MFMSKLGWWLPFLVLLLFGVTAVNGWAAECSLETLKGGYGLDERGTIVALSPPLPFVTSGIIFYDGNGKLSGNETTSLGGGPMPGTFTGTYTVNSDCTYSDSVVVSPSGTLLNHEGTIAGDGISREVHVIETDPGVVSVATIKKTPVGRCSLATLKGTYALFGNGEILVPNTPPILVAQAGIVTFDGAGSFSGEDTASTGGSVTPAANFTGTYSVQPDCRASAVIHSIVGDILEEGVITGEGEFKGFHGIFTSLGWAFAQTLKRQ